MSLLEQYQYPLFPHTGNPPIPIPFIYLPVFVLPFQLLAFLPLPLSFWIWTLLNLIGFTLYLRFFYRNTSGRPIPPQVLFLCILSLPVFTNLFWGQLNILLGIFMGEFLRSILSGKPIKAGLWLGGLLLKPFTLILILPILLIRRDFKVLMGFTLAFITLGMISYGMVGSQGAKELFALYLESARGGSASNPAIMMNWRMLGIHIASLTTTWAGWVAILVGSSATLVATWVIARCIRIPDRIKTTAALLGIFAATSAIAWHAHFPMAIILLPFMVYLCSRLSSANRWFPIWVFTPIVLTLLASILAVATDLSPHMVAAINIQTGMRGLLLNLGVLIWTIYIAGADRSAVSSSPRWIVDKSATLDHRDQSDNR